MRTCKHCKEEKTHEYSHLNLKNGSKVYLDEKGRGWKGATCPPCQAIIRKAQRNAHKAAKVKNNPEPNKDTLVE